MSRRNGRARPRGRGAGRSFQQVNRTQPHRTADKLPTGASTAQIKAHGEAHIRECGCEEVQLYLCPCGTTTTFRCERGVNVFVSVLPGTWCRHISEVLS